MKESYREGLATTLAPSHASTHRKVGGEALTGGSAGRAIELRNTPSPGVPTSSNEAEGNSRHAVNCEACAPHGVVELVHAWTLSARKPGDPSIDLAMVLGSATRNPRSKLVR